MNVDEFAYCVAFISAVDEKMQVGLGKAGDLPWWSFGGQLELFEMMTSWSFRLSPCLLLLPKTMSDTYNQGRILMLGGCYSLRHITKTASWGGKKRNKTKI